MESLGKLANVKPLETATAQALLKAMGYFGEITEYSDRQLKAISIICTDPIMNELLKEYKENKKHLKRKYSKEVREVIRELAGFIHQERRSKWKFWKRDKK